MRQYTIAAIGVGTVACAASVALAALLNVIIENPAISFNDFGTNGTTFTKATEVFSIRTNALALQLAPSDPPIFISPVSGAGFGVLTLDVYVNGSGVLVEGHPGEDLIIAGTVTIGSSTYSGTLLSGEAAAFGHEDSGGSTDIFDFRFTTTGGLLAAPGLPFHGMDIGMRLTSEMSSFVGNFDGNFGGNAKGVVGVILPPSGGGTLGGCTPGYWKQQHHFANWPALYNPTDKFEAIFQRDVPGNPTLAEALRLNGGGLNALMRHSVAALLNSAHPAFNPDPMFDTPNEVINAFRAAFDSGNYEDTKNLMEASNEIGCPL